MEVGTNDNFRRFVLVHGVFFLMAGFCIQERGDVDLMWILDLILTNVPHKQTDVGVFANDLSAIATCRDIKLLKSKPRLISKRDLKHSQEQAFLHDLAFLEWKRGSLFNDVEQAWNFFHNEFLKLINKHAPYRNFRVKG